MSGKTGIKNILVIKQTSLGDVLHSTGHIRAIKLAYPDSHLTLLTSVSCEAIYVHNPYVDRIITVDRDSVKRNGLRHPLRVWRHLADVQRQINERSYDLAIDLQGLLKSVLFLYRAHARIKVVKGRWLGLRGFKNRALHAIDEMTAVLGCVDIEVDDATMAFYTSEEAQLQAEQLLGEINPDSRPLVLISPFTRWQSKNWPLANSIEAAIRISDFAQVAISGAPNDREAIELELNHQLDDSPKIENSSARPKLHNIAGKANLACFAEVMRKADLLITGDSFPMHLAGAVQTPVLAMFGPTDEFKTGPRGEQSQVIRPANCSMCDRANCEKRCLSRISVDQVVADARKQLAASSS